jgi:hypothetical protein
VTAFALPASSAHGSTDLAPAELEGAVTFSFVSPSFVDLVENMNSSSGVDTLTSENFWHLGYAYRSISIDALRLFGTSTAAASLNTTLAAISVAAADDSPSDFPDATLLFSGVQSYTSGQATEVTFTATVVPARRYFLIAAGGGNAGRGRIDGAPSRIGLVGGQPTVGFATGYWTSNANTRDATTLNGFNNTNLINANSVDRVGWRIALA